jgi:molybdate transport system regulatory protein
MPLPSLLTQHLSRRPQRIELLRHVAEQGSITRAAKSAGLSYKAAWDAIDELNNLAQQPLVVRAVGGRGGGGASLSQEGERLLRLYQRLQTLQAQVLEAAEESGDLDLLNRLTLRTSARNQLLGRIVGISRHGHNALIRLQLAGEQYLQAQITHDSTLRLELEPGSDVVALIKAGSLHVLPSDQPETDGQNALLGLIDEVIAAEDGPSEVRIELPGGQMLCALAPADHLADLRLASGCKVQVRFAPSQVLLGTLL